MINEIRKTKIEVIPFRGSSGVFMPNGEDIKGRKNEDYFMNLKAQGWWTLRTRFQNTYRAVVKKINLGTGPGEVDPDSLIVIPSKLKHRAKLCMELSQPTGRPNSVGKIVIDKQPDDTKSPNLADAVMMRYARMKSGLIISEAAVTRARMMGRK